MREFWNEYLQKYFVNMKPEIKLKVALIGESGTGKTCLAMQFATDIFRENISKTVVVDSFQKEIVVGGKRVSLTIWDTGGQQCYKAYILDYIKKADGIVLLYDVTNRVSFNNLRDTWLRDVKQVNKESHLFIVGNKIDLHRPKQVTSSELRDFANSEGLPSMEISAKCGENVEKMFERLVSHMVCGGNDLNDNSGGNTSKQVSKTTSTSKRGPASERFTNGRIVSGESLNYTTQSYLQGVNIKSVLPEKRRLGLNFRIPLMFKMFIYLCIITFLAYYLYCMLSVAFGPINWDFFVNVFMLFQSKWNQVCGSSQVCDKVLSSLKNFSLNLVLR